MINKLQIFIGRRNLRNLRVLDIGCFTGDFLNILEKEKAEVYGVELQKEAAVIANKKFPDRIIKKNIVNLKNEFKHASFDCITMLGLIEHVTNPRKTLLLASRLLKSNGVLIIQTPNSNSLPARLTGKFWPVYTPLEHINIFSKKSLKIELEKLGFKNFKSKRHVKVMPFSYLFQILDTFGPDWKKFLTPLFLVLPEKFKNIPLPFYIGEYLYFAVKK